MYKIYFTTILCFFSILSIGQDIEVGASLGLSNYQGDIASSKIWSANDFNASASIFIKKNISPQWSVKANILFTKLAGNDAAHGGDGEWRARRSYWFKTPLQEFTVVGEWNFLDRKSIKRDFHPYVFIGAGALFSKPTDKSANTNFVLPLGGGFYLDVSDRIVFGMELSSHTPFSDHLDGYSDDGFSEGDDWFTIASASLAYKFGKKRKFKGRDSVF